MKYLLHHLEIKYLEDDEPKNNQVPKHGKITLAVRNARQCHFLSIYFETF